MLVDFAPYLFRGRVAGFLTRLSASGLANVTSGGGQVPAFIVVIPGTRLKPCRPRPCLDPSPRSSRRARATPSRSASRSSRASAWRSSRTRRAARSPPASPPPSRPSARRPRASSSSRSRARPLTQAPPADPRRARARRRRHPVRASAAGRAGLAHGDRRHRGAAADPLRAHGRRHAGDHDAGHARRLPARRSPEHDAVRAHADGGVAARRDRLRHVADGDLRSRAALGQDQRHHQHRATGPTCRPAKCSRRRPRSTACSCATAPRATTSDRSTATSRRRR